MFMVVTYPWPVASANLDLTGPLPLHAAATHGDATDDIFKQPARHLEETVSWTGRERLRLHWYRLRLAIRDIRRPARKTRARSRG